MLAGRLLRQRDLKKTSMRNSVAPVSDVTPVQDAVVREPNSEKKEEEFPVEASPPSTTPNPCQCLKFCCKNTDTLLLGCKAIAIFQITTSLFPPLGSLIFITQYLYPDAQPHHKTTLIVAFSFDTVARLLGLVQGCFLFLAAIWYSQQCCRYYKIIGCVRLVTYIISPILQTYVLFASHKELGLGVVLNLARTWGDFVISVALLCYFTACAYYLGLRCMNMYKIETIVVPRFARDDAALRKSKSSTKHSVQKSSTGENDNEGRRETLTSNVSEKSGPVQIQTNS